MIEWNNNLPTQATIRAQERMRVRTRVCLMLVTNYERCTQLHHRFHHYHNHFPGSKQPSSFVTSVVHKAMRVRFATSYVEYAPPLSLSLTHTHTHIYICKYTLFISFSSTVFNLSFSFFSLFRYSLTHSYLSWNVDATNDAGLTRVGFNCSCV